MLQSYGKHELRVISSFLAISSLTRLLPEVARTVANSNNSLFPLEGVSRNYIVDPLHRDVLPFASTARRWDLFSIQSLSHSVHGHLLIRVQSVEEWFVVFSFGLAYWLLAVTALMQSSFVPVRPMNLLLSFLSYAPST